MCQLDLFGATSSCQQVIYKERDNEKEKSPHTPLKGKEKEKENATTTRSHSACSTQPGARACLSKDGEQVVAVVNSSVKNGKAAPARNQQAMAAAYRTPSCSTAPDGPSRTRAWTGAKRNLPPKPPIKKTSPSPERERERERRTGRSPTRTSWIPGAMPSGWHLRPCASRV